MSFGETFTTSETLLGVRSLQAQESSGAKSASPGSGLGMFLPMILVFVIFYLLMIRPQQKQRKQHQALLQNLKKGDEVVTTSGIHGKIFGVADNMVTLEVADNIRIKMDKPHIATVKTVAVTTS